MGVRLLAFRSPLASFAASILVTGWVVAPAPAPQSETLHLSLSHPPILPHTNALVASRKGIFADAGLDVERKILGSADIIRSALTSGDIDIVGLPTDAVVRARLAGLD